MTSNDRRALLRVLTEFRKRAEQEAGVPCHETSTTLDVALVDVCQSLTLDDEHMRIAIGDVA